MMAAKRKKKSKSKSSAERTMLARAIAQGPQNRVPLKVLMKRARKLTAVVNKRTGPHYTKKWKFVTSSS
jgi:hypothetical protein